MDTSIFIDKNTMPAIADLDAALGSTFILWQTISDYVHAKSKVAIAEWNYPGAKYGWSFRIKDKKRAIIYFLPRDKYFKVAFVFGQKAVDAIMNSSISDAIKLDLNSARVYAEGRGIRIDVLNDTIISDVFTLIDIKLTK